MTDWKVGDYCIYHNGDKYELGRVKSATDTGCFVAYHSGETGAKTPFDLIHPLVNDYCIKDTTLGGDYFKPIADFVDTAEKAAKVDIMSKKDAQATLDYWRMCRISAANHE